MSELTGLTLDRRGFLVRGGAAAAALTGPLAVPASVLGRDGTPGPNARIGVAVIGIGAMGRGHLRWCLGNPRVRVRAVCDVDAERRQKAWQTACDHYGDRDCVAYNDYREILARRDIDAVVIVTPDHWHAPLAMHAAQAGKDVYLEKPVSLTIREGRRLVDVVRRRARVFQTGTQYRSMVTPRRIVRFIRGGGLGKVQSVFALWSQLTQFGGSSIPVDPDLKAEPVPRGLDWDLWVGPAPWHDYNRHYHRNPIPGVVPWAFCEAFGAASGTYHFSHSADVIQYALGMERSGPVAVIHPRDGEFPTLTFRYANGTLLHLVTHWGMVASDYGAVPRDAGIGGNFGGVFVGKRGWVSTLVGKGRVAGGPDDIFTELGMPNRAFNGTNNHHGNWLDCIENRSVCCTDEEIGHTAAALGHLATIAYRLERSLVWDPVSEVFPEDPEANRLLDRAYRQPWRV